MNEDNNKDLESLEFKDDIIDLTEDLNKESEEEIIISKEASEDNIPSQNTHFINIHDENYKKKKKRKKTMLKACFAIGTTVFSLAAVSIGFKTGFIVSNDYIHTKEKTSFKFTDTKNNNSDNNIELLTKSNSVAPIIKKVSDSVVNITVRVNSTNIFYQEIEGTGSGSGIIFKEDNENVYIVTNNHVIDGANAVSISITGEEEVSANLVGKDVLSDIAVLSISKADLQMAGISSVTVASFADSDKLEVGEYVLAVGNALGEGKTVTQGIISADNKTINVDGRKISVIQTDAAINPGNSGGALVNDDGEIIGVNTAKLSSLAIEGIGYAIPSNQVKTIIDSIFENKTIDRPYLGILGFTINDEFRQSYNLNVQGVFITKVEQNSVASAGGLKATDIIVAFNGTKINTIEELSKMISSCKGDETVKINILRNGLEPMTVTVQFGSAAKKF